MISNKRMNQKTEALLKQYNVFKAPVDIFGLIEEIGLDLVVMALDDEMSGFIKIHGDSAAIAVNQDHHIFRQRFTAAHELGHYILHRNSDAEQTFIDNSFSKTIIDKRKSSARKVFNRDATSAMGTQRQEIEANRFAGSILMPESIIEEIVSRFKIDITDEFDMKRLSDKFTVSTQAMTHRLTNLGITYF